MSGIDFPADVVDEWREDDAIIDWSLAVIGAAPEPWDAVMQALEIDPAVPAACLDTGATVPLSEAMRRLATEGSFQVSIAGEPARPFSSIYIWREQDWPAQTMTIELTFFPADDDLAHRRELRVALLERAFGMADRAQAKMVLLYGGCGPSDYRPYETQDTGARRCVVWREGKCTY